MASARKICFVLAPLTAALGVAVALLAAVLCRPVAYVVLVADDLYDSEWRAVFEPADDFVFVPVSGGLPASRLTGRRFVAAALLSLRADMPLLTGGEGADGGQDSANRLCFALGSEDWLPSVPADFKNESSKRNNLLSPALSMSITPADALPPESRALPVDGRYAGEDGYALRVTRFVECTVLRAELAPALESWCAARFGVRIASGGTERVVFVASVGDIMVARGAQDMLISRADGLERVFGSTLPILQGADFTLGNLEGVVTDSWENAAKTYTFRFDKRVLPRLQEAGFDYLMQANNHCYDYGERGFRDTLAAFAEYGVPSSGVGRTAQEARAFYRTTVRGLPLSIISCGAFPAERSGFDGRTMATATGTRAGILWQDEQLLSDIAREKESGAFVIVNVHGGEEYVVAPTKSQRALYESFCDAGADIVFGSHPHVLQPTEWHGGSLIVYSQGNFVFNGMEGMPGATDSEVVRVGILGGRIAYVEQYPARLSGCTVSLVQ